MTTGQQEPRGGATSAEFLVVVSRIMEKTWRHGATTELSRAPAGGNAFPEPINIVFGSTNVNSSAPILPP